MTGIRRRLLNFNIITVGLAIAWLGSWQTDTTGWGSFFVGAGMLVGGFGLGLVVAQGSR